MITVSSRARRHEDRGGDPLDGLVNLFDVGIVLAVAFLLAALASLNLTKSITRTGLTPPKDTINVPSGASTGAVPSSGARTAGEGTEVGSVYRTRDGRLIYVVGTPTPAATSPTR